MSAPFKNIVFLILFAACTRTKVDLKSVLRIGNGTELQSMDPQIATGVPEHNVISALFEGLCNPDPKTNQPIPGTAESWTLSPDQKTYTFKIRKNAKWSNGDSVIAADFVYAWQRVLNPALGAENSYMLYPVKNAEEYNKGKIKDFSQVGVKALDPHTLEVKLRGPTPYFLGLLTHYSTYPLHRATIEKFHAETDRSSKWTQPGNLVGNGAFTLSKWELNKIIVLVKNPLYWDKDSIKLKEVQFFPVEGEQTEERMFRAGELDMTTTIPSNKVAEYKKERPDEIFLSPNFGTYFYRINVTQPQLKDPRVRRALALSVDRQSLVDRVLKSGQLPAYAFTPPDPNGYVSRAQLKYDIPEAKRLMAEAGFPEGKGFKGVQILYNTSEGHRSIAEALQQMWKVNLGIDVTLKNQEWKVYLDTTAKLEYDLARYGWNGDYLDPNSFLDMMMSSSGNNQTGWSNKKYDALINQANNTSDKDQRFELFKQAEEILLTDLPVIPLYTYVTRHLVSKRVSGWYPNILDLHIFQGIDTKE